MIGPFCYHDITTNEEYKEMLKKLNKAYFILSILGVVSILVGIFAHLESYMSGFLCGVGTGLIGSSIALIIKNNKLIKDENKLRQDRIEKSDERNKMISQQSTKTAVLGILLISYLFILISAICHDLTTLRTIMIIIFSFIIIYSLSYKYYSKKM